MKKILTLLSCLIVCCLFAQNNSEKIDSLFELVNTQKLEISNLNNQHKSSIDQLTSKIQLLSKIPILIDADIENGLYQRFPEGTELPPFMGIAATGDSLASRRTIWSEGDPKR